MNYKEISNRIKLQNSKNTELTIEEVMYISTHNPDKYYKNKKGQLVLEWNNCIDKNIPDFPGDEK